MGKAYTLRNIHSEITKRGGWGKYKVQKVDRYLFAKIIRTVHREIVKELFEGHTIIVPYLKGKFSILKYKLKCGLKDGKVTTNRLINWPETNKLWEENPQLKIDKVHVRFDEPYLYKLKFTKINHTDNTNIYAFEWVKTISKKLRKAILDGTYDTIELETFL